ncbi:MAG TPA: V-type ATP synthase subunit F [Syntrophorhabdaceae bacterium]|nr:V-type ATP synthase subunit F [Syntrophorhabdaceae bacterium]
MTFFCIADEDTVRGFRLAGVPGQAVTSAGEAISALHDAIGNSEYAIIVVTGNIASLIRSTINDIRFNRSRPLIVEIPGPEGDLSGRKSLRDLVQEAVGISVG